MLAFLYRIKEKLSDLAQARDEEDFGDEAVPAEDGDEDGEKPSSGLPWEGSDRDYTYEELLGKPGNSSHIWHSRLEAL